MSENSSPVFDVCLLLEGTYPYVSGGVSTWVHNLVSALPEISFTALCILPTRKGNWEIKYDLPDNFDPDFSRVYLHDYDIGKKGRAGRKQRAVHIEDLKAFHVQSASKDYSLINRVLAYYGADSLPHLTSHDMIYGKDAWQMLVDLYGTKENRHSFIDYFWTYRFTHLPLFQILQADIPAARVYHSISTGYAGMVGAMAKKVSGRGFLVTEHGIYTKERKIEIANSQWIYTPATERIKVEKDVGFFHKRWINMFEALGRIAYHEADQLFTLYEGNRELQIKDGADPAKISVIPNGIAISRFSGLNPEEVRTGQGAETPYRIGFMGRVVPIKDVKTFIRACKVISLHIPHCEFLIMGPTEEDEDYYRECVEMVEFLRIDGMLKFTGRVNALEYYKILDIVVLTSISEAQPLVILEANCAGIPVVASDVGACSELLTGRTRSDRALGPSGTVTGVADPSATAKAVMEILENDKLRQDMASAGRRRVEKFYREKDLNVRYRGIYRRYIEEE